MDLIREVYPEVGQDMRGYMEDRGPRRRRHTRAPGPGGRPRAPRRWKSKVGEVNGHFIEAMEAEGEGQAAWTCTRCGKFARTEGTWRHFTKKRCAPRLNRPEEERRGTIGKWKSILCKQG